MAAPQLRPNCEARPLLFSAGPAPSLQPSCCTLDAKRTTTPQLTLFDTCAHRQQRVTVAPAGPDAVGAWQFAELQHSAQLVPVEDSGHCSSRFASPRELA
mmetsp:Transcript_14418/g.43617  ORF Transcript_14418/g.43617 Transcript_14418/m.43617 type:complete len:100 (+) Transcript_14418:1153-1452(+)